MKLLNLLIIVSLPIIGLSQQFNLPSGVVLNSKTNTEIDYSYKLKELPSSKIDAVSSNDFNF